MSIVKKYSEMTLTERLKFTRNKGNRPALLLDTSGSMYGNKIKALIDILNDINSKSPLQHFDIYSFNSWVRKISVATAPELTATGGTNMTAAFTTAKNDGHKQAILITDGLPDNPTQALKEAEGLELNVIYVGPEPRPAFLDSLSNTTTAMNIDIINQQKELADHVILLLEQGRGE